MLTTVLSSHASDGAVGMTLSQRVLSSHASDGAVGMTLSQRDLIIVSPR
jgi:hypothetical protein